MIGTEPASSDETTSCFTAGIGVISQLAYIGAKRVAIDPAICECKYAPDRRSVSTAPWR